MGVPKVNAIKLKQAVEQFGSLEKALKCLLNEKLSIEKENSRLKEENAGLKSTKEKLSAEVEALDKKVDELQGKLEIQSDKFEQYSRQYNLFAGFLAMLADSPSVGDGIENLINSLKKIVEPGWYASHKSDELRAIFVRTVMGDYLKTFRCDTCGTRFIVNKEPRRKYYSQGYWCPVCQCSHGVKEDDSFLKAMVSEEQLENTQRIEQFQKENDALEPLKVFLNLPCEICGQPVTIWTDQDVKRGISGLCWGHTQCWNTSKGQAKQYARLVREELEARMRKY